MDQHAGLPVPPGLAAFHPRRPADLPDPLPGTFAYHVLGAWNTYPDFAVWEEDYMEFLCGLLETPRDTQKNLLRVLKNRSLLLIGAPFGDWIVRFFLRVAKQGRLSDLRESAADYLADRPDLLGEPMIFHFDKVIGTPQLIPAAPLVFTAELRRRWAEKYEAASNEDLLNSISDDMERGSVFISYSRDDMPAAAALAVGLRAAGIPVWLDRRRHGGESRPLRSQRTPLGRRNSCARQDLLHPRHHRRHRQAHPRAGSLLPHPPPPPALRRNHSRLLRRYLDQYHQHGEVRDE